MMGTVSTMPLIQGLYAYASAMDSLSGAQVAQSNDAVSSPNEQYYAIAIYSAIAIYRYI